MTMNKITESKCSNPAETEVRLQYLQLLFLIDRRQIPSPL